MWLDWSKRQHRGLRTWILIIVRNEPKNGVEIMNEMEAGSRGWWRPSPGSVYPMLQRLSEEGLVKKREGDGRYEITPQGREESEWPSRMRHGGPTTVEGVIDELSSYVSYLEDLSNSKDPKLTENAEHVRELARRMTELGKSS
jgi:DNA-binding PadR family transcriptional regulator